MDGANQVNISQSSIYERDPAWSPDGNQIVFTSNWSGNDDIFIMQADGTEVRQLTTHTANDSRPVWMPNNQAQLDVNITYQDRYFQAEYQPYLLAGQLRPYVFVIPISAMPDESTSRFTRGRPTYIQIQTPRIPSNFNSR